MFVGENVIFHYQYLFLNCNVIEDYISVFNNSLCYKINFKISDNIYLTICVLKSIK